jgi:RHS repeat-associated protein
VELDGRTVSGGYRFGFQNQEKDDEIKGEGNSVNYTFRMHDPRLGRFFSIDPFEFAFPHNSHYVFSENIVVNALELEGLEKVYVYNVYKKYGMTIKKLSHTYIDENLTDHRRVIRYFNEKGEIVKTVIKNIDGWDAADLVVGSAGIVATAVTILSTNPAGWVIIATGATIYGGFRFGYQIYTE